MASEQEQEVEDAQVSDEAMTENKTSLLAKGILGVLTPAVEKVDEKIDAVR